MLKKTVATSLGVAALTLTSLIFTSPDGSAAPAVPTALDCKGNRQGENTMEVRCYNLSSTSYYTVRVSIDCGYWPDPSATFYIPPNDDRRQTFECNGPGGARGTYKWEVIE